MTMLEQIINAMNELGGHCYFKDLYQQMLNDNPECTNSYINEKGWKSAVRTAIRRSSSDSVSFNKGSEDLFYIVEHKGKGHWGLRKPKITETGVDLTNDDEGFEEGKAILRKHVIRERNHFLKITAIKQFKATHDNRVFCECCGFDFYEKYGELGKDFIEVHHTKPISEMKEGEKTKIEDVVLLCSNCHSMIHRRRPWLHKEYIRKILNQCD